MFTVVKMKFGSHLYGTDTPESDLDIKGIFIPDARQVYLGKIPKTIVIKTNKKANKKNTKDDVDIEWFSLQYFIQLACEGQTIALDMLHAPESMWIECPAMSPWWEIIRHREKLYTKNLHAFVGYARRQASKYGIKGSRLNTAQRVIDFLETVNDPNLIKNKLSVYWKELPTGENIRFLPMNQFFVRSYEVCGKKFQETTPVNYVIDALKAFHHSYGERARQAANNEGIDWKAVSHAIRSALQVRELLTDNTITFPLKDATLVKGIKAGQLDYQTIVAPMLENLMEQVEELSAKSKLPDKVDQEFWDELVIRITKTILKGT